MTTHTTDETPPPRAPRKRRGKTPTLEEVKAFYRLGNDFRAVATHFNLSYGKAREMVHESGAEVRKRGGYRPPLAGRTGTTP